MDPPEKKSQPPPPPRKVFTSSPDIRRNVNISPNDLKAGIGQLKKAQSQPPKQNVAVIDRNLNGVPPPPTGQQKPKPSKWKIDTGDRTEWNFRSSEAHKSKSLNEDIVWEDAIGFSRSDGGSEGVFFLGFEGNAVLVLKGSSSVFSDVLATELGMIAKMPLIATKTIASDHPDFKRIIHRLHELDSRHPENLRGRHKAMCRAPILQIMEFVDGWDFKHVSPDFVFPSSDQKLINERAIVIGRLQVFDVFINNWDRIPTIHNSNGNIANLFYVSTTQKVIGIDQQTKTIPLNTENFEWYINQVDALLTEIIEFDDKKSESYRHVNKLRVFLRDKSSMRRDIGEAGTRSCWIGMMIGVCDIVNNIDSNTLQLFKTKIEKQVQDLDVKGDFGLSFINFDFLDAVLKRFIEHCPNIQKRLDAESRNR